MCSDDKLSMAMQHVTNAYRYALVCVKERGGGGGGGSPEKCKGWEEERVIVEEGRKEGRNVEEDRVNVKEGSEKG
jgi:hypothetical protein